MRNGLTVFLAAGACHQDADDDDGSGDVCSGTSCTTSSDTDTASDTDVPAVPGACGELVSVFTLGGPGFDSNSELAVAADGSRYVAGRFDQTLTIGPGTPAETTLSPDVAGLFLARYDADGPLAWAVGVRSSDLVTLQQVRAIDGGVVLSGTFYGSLEFGDAPATILTTSGFADAWLARFDATGALVWARSAGGPASDDALDHVVLSDQSVVIGGVYRGNARFGSGEPEEITLPIGSSMEGAWLARYGADGALRWAQNIPGTTYARLTSLAVGAGDLVTALGTFSGVGSASFGVGQPGEVVVDPDGADSFFAHWAADGTFADVQALGDLYPERVEPGPTGAVLMTGQFQGTVTLGEGEPNETTLTQTGNSNAWFARYESDGTLGWAAQTASTDDGVEAGAAVAPTPDGGMVAIGSLSHPTRFDAGTATEVELTADGQFTDTFAVRYDASGRVVCALSIPAASADFADDIVALPNGSLWFSSTFGDSPARVGAGTPNETEVTGAGDHDVLVANFWF